MVEVVFLFVFFLHFVVSLLIECYIREYLSIVFHETNLCMIANKPRLRYN